MIKLQLFKVLKYKNLYVKLLLEAKGSENLPQRVAGPRQDLRWGGKPFERMGRPERDLAYCEAKLESPQAKHPGSQLPDKN